MTDRATPRADLREEFTGLVAASLAVSSDVDRGEVPCRASTEPTTSASAPTDELPDGSAARTLGSADRVTATLTCYDNYSWEVLGIFCSTHAVSSVATDMGVTAEDQAVIETTLEETGYRSPLGDFYPNALSFGAVEILDFSPAAEGY
ncbi:hypothetical protein BRD01_03220 [Halobacteriales archaeon QS_8_65_32]|jgi:hypothetical protein|nr:MAG: hypothetical protein BRD01_03220 [Halobacteriales archaeon QS_8_65_32]